MNEKVSVCIPRYEMKGKGAEYLDHSFNLLYAQSYKNFEVIISDNSKNDNIKKLCEIWSDKLNINYFLN